MLNIPEAIKTLYKQDSVRKNFRVHFPNGEMPDITNANIVSESVSFTESLCSQQYLKFGLTEASEIQFETVGIGNMLGMTIECYNEIDVTQMPGADDPVEQYHLKDDTAIVTASYFANGATESDGTWTYKRFSTTANFKNSDGSYYMPEVGDYVAYEAEGTAWQIEQVGYQTNNQTAKSTKDVFDTTDPTEQIISGSTTETKRYVLYTPKNYVFYKPVMSAYYHYIGTLDSSSEDYYTLRASVATAWSLLYQCIGSYVNDEEPNYETARAAVGEASYIPYWKTIGGMETSDVPYPYYRVPYGIFVVEQCPRSHGAMTHRRVVARTNGGQLLKSGTLGFKNVVNTTLPLSKLKIDPYGLLALIAPQEYTASHDASPSFSTGDNLHSFYVTDLYNSSGKRYFLRLQCPEEEYWFEETLIEDSIGRGWYDEDTYFYDVFKATYTTDSDAYDTFGMSIVNHLNELGLNLAYNSSKVKIYKNNEDALRKLHPYLFHPSLSLMEQTTNGGSANNSALFGFDWSINVVSGRPLPLFHSDTDTHTVLVPGDDPQYYDIPAAFSGTCVNTSNLNNVFYCIRRMPSSMLVGTYNNSGEIDSWVGDRLDFSGDMYFETNVVSEVVYYIKDYKTRALRNSMIFENTNKVANALNYHSWNSSWLPNATKRVNGYQFVDSFDFEKVIQGYLELNGQFLKPSRSGGLELVRLCADNDVYEASRSDYEDLWWDEYDVRPIGSVSYKTNEGKDTAVYQFGEGESTYDMTGNEYLNSLTSVSSEQINALLDESFVPNVQSIIFTPFDMTAKGVPYIEIGDAIAAETGAEDVPTVNSFLLHRSVSGIQSLMDSFEATGGEIMDEIEVE